MIIIPLTCGLGWIAETEILAVTMLKKRASEGDLCGAVLIKNRRSAKRCTPAQKPGVKSA